MSFITVLVARMESGIAKMDGGQAFALGALGFLIIIFGGVLIAAGSAPPKKNILLALAGVIAVVIGFSFCAGAFLSLV